MVSLSLWSNSIDILHIIVENRDMSKNDQKKDIHKRVNITIPTSYHEEVHKRGINLSGLVREAIEDQLSENSITISVSKETHSLYRQIFNETQSDDSEFEPFLKKALQEFIDFLIQNRVESLEEIKQKLK